MKKVMMMMLSTSAARLYETVVLKSRLDNPSNECLQHEQHNSSSSSSSSIVVVVDHDVECHSVLCYGFDDEIVVLMMGPFMLQ